MSAYTFESKIQSDGSVSVPMEAAEQLDLHPGDPVTVRIETGNGSEHADLPPALRAAVTAMMARTPADIAAAQERAMAAHQPRQPLPNGKTLADVVSGQ